MLVHYKQRQRLLSFLLILAILFSLFPISAGAQVINEFPELQQSELSVTQATYELSYQEKIEGALTKAKSYYQGMDTAVNNSGYYTDLAAMRSANVNLSTLVWKSSPWDHSSIWQIGTEQIYSETEYAGFILGLLALGENPKAFGKGKLQRNLIEELVDRQNTENGSFGSSLYDHLWAMIALDAVQAKYDHVKAVNYLLEKQNTVDGSFQASSFWDGVEYVDDVTGWSLVALASHKGKTNVQVAITKAVDYLYKKQKGNGDFADDVNTLSVIISGLVAVGEDLSAPKWTKNGQTPLDALLKYQTDSGYFKWMVDIEGSKEYATRDAVIALGELASGQSIWQRLSSLPKPTPVYGIGDGGGGGTAPLPKIGTITISVTGLAGQGNLLAPTTIDLWSGDTAFTVLVRALPHEIDFSGSGSTAYVYAIKGLREFEHGAGSGWMYLVDGVDPQMSAGIYELRDGQRVEWKYTTNLGQDIGAGGGGGGGTLPAEYASKQNDLNKLNFGADNQKPVQEVGKTVIVTNKDKQMSKEEAEKLRAKLEKHMFTIQQAIAPALGGHLKDEQGEIDLFVLSGAIERPIDFQVQKLSQTLAKEEYGVALSGIYEFSPAGTTFTKPVFISIQVPLLVDNLDDLALAWWNEKTNQWIPIPAVVDAQTGIITGTVTHFTKFAVIDKSKLPGAKKEEAWQLALRHTLELIKKKQELSEWEALSLALAGESVSTKYLRTLEDLLKENKGQFRKITDLERIVITLAALGKDPQNIAGFNLLEKIYNHPNLTMQGTNGAAFTLLALDSKAYPIAEDALWNRDKLVQWILAQQNADGGFSLSKAEGGKSDVDITAMVLQSLAVYQKRADVKEAIELALVWLAKQQLESGGFVNIDGEENSESVAQVVLALTSLGLNPLTQQFVKGKGDLLSNLLTFAEANGGFAHSRGQGVNSIATEQALLALLAYERYQTGKSPLFDMRKVSEQLEQQKENQTIVYLDAHKISPWAVSAVQKAGQYGLMQGVSSDQPRFEPQRPITRAEFAALLIKLAGDEATASIELAFADVQKQHWYYRAVTRAVENGWVKGVSAESFEPNRSITREEMAVIIGRLLQLETSTNPEALISDLEQASTWAIPLISQVYAQQLMVGDQGNFKPQDKVTREMAAAVMVRLFERQQ